MCEQQQQGNPSSYPDAEVKSKPHQAPPPPLPILDFGNVIKALMAPQEVEVAIGAMTSGEKYKYLTNNFKPSEDYLFPTVHINGCNHQVRVAWQNTYPWFVHSLELDGGFCLSCALFSTERESKGILVNKLFAKWTKNSEVLQTHAKVQYHQTSLTFAVDFKHRQENPEQAVRGLFHVSPKPRILENRHIVKQIARGILF